MAVFVDLDEDDVNMPDPRCTPDGGGGVDSGGGSPDMTAEGDEADKAPGRENPKRNSMSEALGCYPIIRSVAESIDLNTLDSLSRTCRQLHAGLLQYRTTLIQATLHCVNEHVLPDPDDVLRYRARAGNWFYMEDISRTACRAKTGRCARDMVGECRRCGTVVCRNCTIKPPAPIILRDRLRRLCPCGRTIRSDDVDYKSTWRWRIHYGEDLGSLGIGIGDGDRGVICGRGRACCASRDCEQETDCDAEDARDAGATPATRSSSSSSSSSGGGGGGGAGSLSRAHSMHSSGSGVANGPGARTPSPALGPGYQRQEIEGIGGVVKTKFVRIMKVGACVLDYEDERASGDVLSRECKGQLRSWVGPRCD
ncbi:hypothetical protein P8C59_002968 [Phyllachora maydis]|uniref:Uncharacterized protein n=1 Tax=Phyllachora maydis TaxID=1825666 RepID=A0AAD9MAY6_9PEZI|nr:hypothetical protein P8C59_002968 [Phyllachora maydis]